MVALLPNHSKSKVLDYHVDESLSFHWSVNKVLLMFLLCPYFMKNRFLNDLRLMFFFSMAI
jgi:hypothetical protein